MSFDEEREFDPEERAFLGAATQQAAHALHRARLYEEERLRAQRQRLLAEAGELFARSLDPDATMRELAGLAVKHVAEWCAVDMVDEERGLRHVAVAHRDPERVRLAEQLRERYPVDPHANHGVPNVIRTGVAEFHPEIEEELLEQSARDAEHLELLRELGLRSATIVPLWARGSVLGAMSLVATDRAFTEADLELAEDLARRAGLAADNAILFRREHEAAMTLQRSLLPDAVPRTHAGLEFEVRYRPAGAGLEVGGDWYEIVPLGESSVALTIGDVAGRGIRAASVMGRVRQALRAYVLDGNPPREAVARLDRLMRENGRRDMTTVFHLQFDSAAGTARYVRAGHPPALLRGPEGDVVELTGGGTPPLGIFEDVTIVEHEIEISPDSLLLVYTDGLIERHDTDLSESLDQLRDAFSLAPAAPGECLDWLDERLGTESIRDDVAMLAMATGSSGRPAAE